MLKRDTVTHDIIETAGIRQMSGARLPQGGRIDRNAPVRFRFAGKPMTGFKGDTLASALLANGVDVTARSFKYHRPRGIMGAGIEEPATYVELEGEEASANQPATTVLLKEGLRVKPLNCWPSVDFDMGAVNQLFRGSFRHRFTTRRSNGPIGICSSRRSGALQGWHRHHRTAANGGAMRRAIGIATCWSREPVRPG